MNIIKLGSKYTHVHMHSHEKTSTHEYEMTSYYVNPVCTLICGISDIICYVAIVKSDIKSTILPKKPKILCDLAVSLGTCSFTYT